MIKMIQKQVSEKLRQKMKIETEIKELEEQMQTTEKEQTVVANMLKEKRKE
jgi:chromosome segregation ATPase